MKTFNIFSVLRQRVHRSPLLTLRHGVGESQQSWFYTCKNGVNPRKSRTRTVIDPYRTPIGQCGLLSLGSRVVAVLCLLLTIGVGNAWGDSTYTLGWGTATGSSGTYTNFTTTSGSVTNIVSFSTAKNDGSNEPAYNSSSSELRLYYNSGGNGGSITLTPASGIIITGFVMTTSTSPSVKYSVDGGSATSVSASSNTYTVSSITAYSSVTIQNVNTSNTQLRIKTIQISYTTAPSYSVSWSVNGENWNTGHGSPSTSVYSGSKVTALPTAPTSSACDNSKVFVGWTNSSYSHASTAPTILFTDATGAPAVTANVTYYAVFATATPANKTVTYSITSKNTFGTPTGTPPTGSSASITETYSTSKQMTKDNSQTVTLTGWGTTSISNITLSMKSNGSGGGGTLSYSTNSGSSYTDITSGKFNTSNWYGSWSSSFVEISKDVSITGVADNTIMIKITASDNSIYCESYSFTYTGYTYSNYATSCGACTASAVIGTASLNGPIFCTYVFKAISPYQPMRYRLFSTLTKISLFAFSLMLIISQLLNRLTQFVHQTAPFDHFSDTLSLFSGYIFPYPRACLLLIY
ncbi:MAG: hypothetical protein IJT12_07250 [Paludibacteraceae bacterium]|nr:hypothetical protein [Paludibacteraceae bacterium]